ncbi:glycosyltransferase family 2 protein [Bradyrhizobium lablabi]|uniref:glycosyltransferase family 2 protein n=1 Tax=Bradyrhizobium lablabi TaxID=722472 RepID=UPI001BAB9FE9|nr:glycosyltransferase family 2 protein [Bradyrhizobium lablabi]MBR0697800.1 glycosyltransferase [Bradyrhizobium lablabi]
MLTLISATLVIAAVLISIPVVVFFIEVVASLGGAEPHDELRTRDTSTGRVAIVVPAHNESSGVVPTIQDIKPQLSSMDQLVVVADNCTDDTATVADLAGAEVVTRNNLAEVGKGFALARGINHLSSDPPDYVVFVDADCRMEKDAIARLVAACERVDRPVQARYLMRSPENSPIDHSFAEFAWIVRNWARPLGLSRLGGPVQLMGTGMIFPWELIRSASLASGHLVEDMKLGLDLAAKGKAPVFLPSAVCLSEFPVSEQGADSQRQRWIQGHIGTMLRTAPRLLVRAIAKGDIDLLFLTLDLLVPPLSLLGLLVATTFLLSCLAALSGLSTAAAIIAFANVLLFVLALLFAWITFGKDVLPARAIASKLPLIARKFALYGQMLLGRRAGKWVRTDRGRSE